MQITVTPAQASKIAVALRALYDGKGDQDIEEVLDQLAVVIASRAQERYCVCGKLIPLSSSGRPRQFCSDKCRQQSYRDSVKARKRTTSRPQRTK